jgi:transposase-like protein
MNTKSAHPQTLLEAVRHFSDLAVCHEYMMNIKWPDGKIICPKCGGEHVGEIKSRMMFQCKAKDCRKQFSTKVGTIFEDSPLGLDKWFVAVWCIVNAKNGISSYEVHRALGVTQKSAWHMLHRVRMAMQTRSFNKKMTGEVESDETFVGGLAKNMHKAARKAKITGTGGSGKAIVHGLLERGGHVRARVVPSVSKRTLHSQINDNVEKGAALYTDSLAAYKSDDLAQDYLHAMVDHTVEYVSGRVHVNGMENFWSLLKRGLKGTYVAVAPFHLQRYVDEQIFRFNKRNGSDATRFLAAMLSVCGKRLTFAELTGTQS